MPVAHALVQAREDARAAAAPLDRAALWHRPNGAASAGFHLFHAAHVVDRLLAYARGEALTDAQRAAFEKERAGGDTALGAGDLVRLLDETVERALAQLRATPEHALLEPRAIGRAALPSNVLGVLFHAAEHTTRHVGQLITTAKVLSK
jgi:hypothetical protein